MNTAVFDAARQAGCTTRQAEVLAVYVESETIRETAKKLRLAEQTVKNHLAEVRSLLDAPHTAGVLGRLLARTKGTGLS